MIPESGQCWNLQYHPTNCPTPITCDGCSDLNQASAQATYADFQANNNFDVMARLPEIRTPALVVGGSEDRMAPQKFAEFLAKGIAGARLEILTSSGHYPMVEQEEGFNRSLEEFLSAAATASADA